MPEGRGPDIHNRDGIVVEDCRHVFRGELVCRVADEKTCLANRTVADDHAPKTQLLGQRQAQLLGYMSGSRSDRDASNRGGICRVAR